MELFNDQDIRVDRIWRGESIGTKLVIQHTLTGLTLERIIGFEDEGRHRKELVAELSHRFSALYPPQDFVLENLWSGLSKGSSLCLRHTPSGLEVNRATGSDSVARHHREMVTELFQKLRERTT